MFGAISQGKDTAVAFYNKWVDEVKATVPKEKLLIHNVKDGWEPLCKHLGVPMPDKPYPRTNDTATIRARMKIFKYIEYFYYFMFTGLCACAFAYFFH